MEFKKGMTVGVRANCEKYRGRLAGRTGVVAAILYNTYPRRIGVLLDGMTNPNSMYGYYYFEQDELSPVTSPREPAKKPITPFAIKNVYFNDPVTVVMWEDGTKTIVRCSENDTYDPEMGLAMAISKKALGNKGNYYNEFKKWLPKEESLCDTCIHQGISDCFACLASRLAPFNENLYESTNTVTE